MFKLFRFLSQRNHSIGLLPLMALKTSLLVSGVLFAASLSTPPKLQAEVWQNIRDGVVHIRVPAAHSDNPPVFDVQWTDAWISEAQEDHLYLQNPDGSLARQFRLDQSNTPGQTQFTLNATGDYQFHVTGTSFRYVSLGTYSQVPTLFEPVKVHKSASLPAGGTLYFQVPANTAFTFAGKYHGGVSGYELSPLGSDDTYTLELNNHNLHWQYDSVKIPAYPKQRNWKLTWEGSGKTAFWLDDIPNLFAQKEEYLFHPKLSQGQVQVKIEPFIVGQTPAVGSALPFVNPPEHTYPLLEKWQLGAANHYTFADTLQRSPEADLEFLNLYENRFNIKRSNTILAETGRQAVIDDVDKIKPIVLNYLKQRHEQGLLKENYFAIADEPNLNYPSYDRYESDFAALASAIKNHPDPAINSTKLAAPQSSRFIQAPTRSHAEERRGIDWAERIIKKYGQWVDAISWHEWMVRDLIDTSRYREAVEAADELARRYRPQMGKEPALIIGQTNISSGWSLSPYEQDTEFSALWWTSVVIQSSLPGKLNQIIWFKAADDPNYRKGLATVDNKGFTEKPVSEAMAFINEHLGYWVLQLQSTHPEVDILATLSRDKRQLKILGVNKSRRTQQLHIQLPKSTTGGSLVTLSMRGRKQISTPPETDALSLPLAGETLFAWELALEDTVFAHEVAVPVSAGVLKQ